MGVPLFGCLAAESSSSSSAVRTPLAGALMAKFRRRNREAGAGHGREANSSLLGPAVHRPCNILGGTEYPGLTVSELVSSLRPAQTRLPRRWPQQANSTVDDFAQCPSQARQRNYIGRLYQCGNESDAGCVQDHTRFEALKGQLNAVLVLYGFRVNDQGRLARGAAASTSLGSYPGCPVSCSPSCDGEVATTRSCSTAQKSSSASPSFMPSVRPPRASRTGYGATPNWPATVQHCTTKSSEPTPRRRLSPSRTWPTTPKSASTEVSRTCRSASTVTTEILGAHRTRLGSTEERHDFFDAFALFSYVHRRRDQAGSER